MPEFVAKSTAVAGRLPDMLVGSIWMRGLAAVCLIMIALLSLWPGHWQQHVALPGVAHHFVAYCGTAIVLVFARRRSTPPVTIVLGLALLGGLMELLQFFSPGRDPQVAGFAASAVGGTFGAMVGFIGRRCLFGLAPAAASLP